MQKVGVMKKPKYTKLSVYLAACIFALVNFAFRQNSVGLKGGVFDERGAAIAGATVGLESVVRIAPPRLTASNWE